MLVKKICKHNKLCRYKQQKICILTPQNRHIYICQCILKIQISLMVNLYTHYNINTTLFRLNHLELFSSDEHLYNILVLSTANWQTQRVEEQKAAGLWAAAKASLIQTVTVRTSHWIQWLKWLVTVVQYCIETPLEYTTKQQDNISKDPRITILTDCTANLRWSSTTGMSLGPSMDNQTSRFHSVKGLFGDDVKPGEPSLCPLHLHGERLFTAHCLWVPTQVLHGWSGVAWCQRRPDLLLR